MLVLDGPPPYAGEGQEVRVVKLAQLLQQHLRFLRSMLHCPNRASPAKAGAQERAVNGGGSAQLQRPLLLGPGLRRGSAGEA
jgi:hypothetical protein